MNSSKSISDKSSQLSPLKQAYLALEDMQVRLEASERSRHEPIAIIGLGCRFPGANNPSSFWKLLQERRDLIREVPESRWNIENYYDPNPDAPGKLSSRWGGFLDQVDEFDPEFFGISPREAISMDPQQRLLLEVAWEALEDAGQGPRDLSSSRTGVFVGLTSDEYALLSYRDGDLSRFNPYFASGIARSVAGGRISYVLGLDGPNMSIDTACSSSLVALHSACLSLRMQECHMALAGGATVVLSPEIGIAFSKAHMLSSDGRCKTFDARADGFVRGEGCGMVVLKRLSDAESDGDHVWGVIRGTAVNQDGRSSGMTAPSGKAQEAVIRAALAQAGVSGEEIGYVEAHGTGTALGDPIEAHALAAVLGVGRGAENPLVVGSVKTNVGHLEAAAGIAGLIKAVLSLEHERIPAHLHFEQMNPHIDWGGVPVEIPVSGRAWPRGERRRLAGVSSFGFSGTNAHVIVEEAPQPPARAEGCERPLHVLALSARSETALGELGGRYAAVLEQSSGPVGDVCFTANAGRAHFEHRLAVTGSSSAELRSALLKALPGGRVQEREGIRPVFLFPGQGAQYAGMGRQLYETQPVFRAAMEQCAEGLSGELDRPLLEVLWGRETDLLAQTAYTQPGLFAVEYAVAALWRSWGIEPAVVLGHSVGEYVAACVAGVYSLGDGLKLIARRGRLMQAVGGQGAMAAVEASEIRVGEALRGLEERVTVAAINAPEQTVISGYEGELRIVEQRLMESGVRVHRLKVSHGFHSPQMREMEAAFAEVAQEIQFQAPRLRVISSVTGQAVSGKEMSQPAYWRCQVGAPVRFSRAMETLRESEATVFLEAGPGATLAALGQQSIDTEGTLWLASLRRNREEWPQLLDTLAQLYVHGADVNWTGFDKPYPRRRLSLPTYPFQRQSYWMQPASPSFRSAAGGSTELIPPRIESTAVTPDLAIKGLDEWFYRVNWRERGLPTQAEKPIRQCWILIPDGAGVANALAGRIRSSGGECILIDATSVSIGQALNQFAAAPANIIDLRCLDIAEGLAEQPCLALASLVQEVARFNLPKVTVWSITRGAQATGRETSPVLPWLAPVWALGRTMVSEHSELWGGMVDLDPAATCAENADLLWRHLAGFDGEDQAAFRNGSRMVARLERFVPPPEKNPEFDEDAAYLITGGYGGLGLEIARWMVGHRAKRIILIGRTALPPRNEWNELPANDATYRVVSTIGELEKLGAEIQTAAVDVGDADALGRFFRSYKEAGGPPIRGLVHAAGAMKHVLVSEATQDDFRISFRAKVDGTWFLHQALRETVLDFFIMFSSASAVLSSPRLGPYAASNAFLDAMAEYRNKAGLSALSVNWGIWTGIGMAGNSNESSARTLADRGLDGMKAEDGLACLERLMTETAAQVCVLPLDWKKWHKLYPAYMAKPFFSDLIKENLPDSPAAGSFEPTNEFLEHLKEAPESVRLDMVREFVQKVAVGILGFPVGSRLDPLQPLNELGMDSLMAVELRNSIATAIAQTLPATLLFNYPAVEDITTYIARLLFDAPVDKKGVGSEEKRNALDDVEGLSDEEVDRILTKNWNAANE
jgi:acyl transferase domain-containing protein/acyl carrier protein